MTELSKLTKLQAGYNSNEITTITETIEIVLRFWLR